MTGFISSDPLDNLTNVYQRPPCITAFRAPTLNDVQPPMTFWEDTSVTPPLIYQTTGAGLWALSGSSTSSLNTLSDTASTLVTPTAGNIQISGTTNQVNSTAGTHVITLSTPSTFIAPGSIASTTTLTSGTSLAVTTFATIGTTLAVTGTTTLAAVNATNGTFSGTLGVTSLTTLGALTQVGATNINASGSSLTTIGTGGTGVVHIGNATGNTAVTGSLSTTTSISATTTVTGGTGITATTGNVVATAGAINAGTSMTATLGNITATNGNIVLNTAGNKLVIATGSNASVGTSGAMTGTPGAITVATTASSATAKIFYSRNATGGTPGQVSITAQDGTGFTLTSTGNETSTFNWWIINA